MKETLDYLALHPNTLCSFCGKNYSEKKIKLCGCGRHGLLIDDDDLVRYRGQWWTLRCLYYKIDKRLPKLANIILSLQEQSKQYRKIRAKFIKMKRILRKHPCYYCGKSVGNRWIFLEKKDDLACPHCHSQL